MYIIIIIPETAVEIQESVRGKDVYIIQTGTKLVLYVRFCYYAHVNVKRDLKEQFTLR